MTNLKDKIKDNYILLPFLILFIILSFAYPYNIKNYYKFVDWNTIVTLIGLLTITTAIKECRFFRGIVKKVLTKIKDERKLSFVLILFSLFLSMFLTNDIALFISIPLTIEFQSYIKNDIKKLIIFEAIAVNVGSMLTPIGNPQNIFIWHQWGISFVEFIIKMFPMFLLLFFILFIFVFFFFSSVELSIQITSTRSKPNIGLFYFSIVLLIVFIITMELRLLYYSTSLIIAIYAVIAKDVLKKVDWVLILMFIIMFVDFHAISIIPVVSEFTKQFNLNNQGIVFTLSLGYSQLISNVPTSIFMSRFSHDWLAIAYGVNIGGNGFIIGSLANIIALRFNNSKKIWIEFHKYSLLFFVVTGILSYLIFFK